jgi:hypothetical protein
LMKITTKSKIINVKPEQMLIVYLAEVWLSSHTCSNIFVISCRSDLKAFIELRGVLILKNE